MDEVLIFQTSLPFSTCKTDLLLLCPGSFWIKMRMGVKQTSGRPSIPESDYWSICNRCKPNSHMPPIFLQHRCVKLTTCNWAILRENHELQQGVAVVTVTKMQTCLSLGLLLKWKSAARAHNVSRGIQNSMEAILTCHPVLRTEWLGWVALLCELRWMPKRLNINTWLALKPEIFVCDIVSNIGRLPQSAQSNFTENFSQIR